MDQKLGGLRSSSIHRPLHSSASSSGMTARKCRPLQGGQGTRWGAEHEFGHAWEGGGCRVCTSMGAAATNTQRTQGSPDRLLGRLPGLRLRRRLERAAVGSVPSGRGEVQAGGVGLDAGCNAGGEMLHPGPCRVQHSGPCCDGGAVSLHAAGPKRRPPAHLHRWLKPVSRIKKARSVSATTADRSRLLVQAASGSARRLRGRRGGGRGRAAVRRGKRILPAPCARRRRRAPL